MSYKYFITALVDGKRINAQTNLHPVEWKEQHTSRDVVITFWHEEVECSDIARSFTASKVLSEAGVGKDLYIITGGLGFIGKNFMQNLYDNRDTSEFCILNIDCVTYAADITSGLAFESNHNYYHLNTDICDPFLTECIRGVIPDYKVFNKIHAIHFAAESHVDNSIDSSAEFVKTNVQGTMNIMDSLRNLGVSNHHGFNFVHCSLTFDIMKSM